MSLSFSMSDGGRCCAFSRKPGIDILRSCCLSPVWGRTYPLVTNNEKRLKDSRLMIGEKVMKPREACACFVGLCTNITWLGYIRLAHEFAARIIGF